MSFYLVIYLNTRTHTHTHTHTIRMFGYMSAYFGATRFYSHFDVNKRAPRTYTFIAYDTVTTVRSFSKHKGFPSKVAKHLTSARRKSASNIYQSRRKVYRSWCHDRGLSVS